MQFMEKKLEQRNYITIEILPITKRVELIDKKGFAATALDENAKIFVIYVAILSMTLTLAMQVHLSQQAQV